MAIITISREMGSGGIPIAHKVAEKLSDALVEGEAVKQAAAAHGLSPEAFEKADEKPPAFVEELDEQIEVDLHQLDREHYEEFERFQRETLADQTGWSFEMLPFLSERIKETLAGTPAALRCRGHAVTLRPRRQARPAA